MIVLLHINEGLLGPRSASAILALLSAMYGGGVLLACL